MSCRVWIAAAVLSVGFAGCGGEGPLAAATGGSCAQIADDSIEALNDAIGEMGSFDMAELMKEGAETPELSAALQGRFDALEGRADKADCSDEKMKALFKARADEIKGEGFFADLMRGALAEGGNPFGDDPSGGGAPEEGDERTTTVDPRQPGRRAHPLPIGTTAKVDGWVIKVLGATPNANRQVLGANQFNEAPAPGKQFFMAKVEATYEGGQDATKDRGNLFMLEFQAVGDKSVGYSEAYDDCGVVPDEIDGFKDVYVGGRISGNVCWAIDSADEASLVLRVSKSFGGTEVFFALR